MQKQQINFNFSAKIPLHCSYDQAYESMYDSSYGTGFVFYDEDELETDDGCTLIPSDYITPSGFFQG